MPVSPAEREVFDAMVESILDALPPRLIALLDEAPLVVEDAPSPELLRELGMTPGEADELCGLHSGSSLTDRSFAEGLDDPEMIQLFRAGIVAHAGGWSGADGGARIRAEIRITLLHEIGHHFGLEEDDLTELGYE